MTHGNDAQFLVRRENEERAIADAATDPMIKGIHEALAEGYADRGSGLKSHRGDGRATAVDGSVTVATKSGENPLQSPPKAGLTSDILIAILRDAEQG